MHTRGGHAEHLRDRGGHYYLLTEGNKPTPLRRLRALPWAQIEPVRDVTYNEDRSAVRTGHEPQVRAALRNLAITALRQTHEQLPRSVTTPRPAPPTRQFTIT